MEIRLLKADEIDVRAQSVSDKNNKIGAILLLYKDARVDMRILDETFGMFGWQRKHEVINNNLFCTISIFNEKFGWVDKQDVGIESNTEKEKGEASDSFKRAAFNVGIGRELYTGPFIWVDLAESEIYEDKGKKKLKQWIKFSVKEIGYNEAREINNLIIVDNNGKERFRIGKTTPKVKEPKIEPTVKNFFCEDCQKQITDYGKTTAEEVAKQSKEKSNKVRCVACMLAWQAKEKKKLTDIANGDA